jgi:putative hydrolase of the HAD superfamily
MRHHGVRPDEYLEYIHDVPVSDLVLARPELSEMLADCPSVRLFTNGSRDYARRVLEALGVDGRMEGIYG